MNGKKYFLNACAGCFSEIPQPGKTHQTFSEITGRLLHVQFKTTKAGEVIRLYVVDESNLFILSMFVTSRPAQAFFLVARNLSLRSEMKFKMRQEIDPKDNSLKDFLSIHQFDNSVRWAFDQSNQHQLPRDREEKRAYLRSIVENEIIPDLQKIVNPFPAHPVYKPLGSGNGLQGGYFGNRDSLVRTNAVSQDEVKAAGFSTRRAYVNQNIL